MFVSVIIYLFDKDEIFLSNNVILSKLHNIMNYY